MSEIKDLRDQIEAARLHELNGMPLVIVPDGYGVKQFPELRKAPARFIGKRAAQDVESTVNYAVAYVNEESQGFVDTLEHIVQIVFDYGKSAPGFRDHTLSYAPRLSPSWKTWNDAANRWLDQTAFADFLDDNSDDVQSPTGAALLELVTNFRQIQKAEFSSSQRLQTGEFSFTYAQENQKGTVEVPELIVLGLAPFHNGAAYEISARLRYKIQDGKLYFMFKLNKVEKIIDAAFADDVQAIRDGLLTVDFFNVVI